MPPRKRCPQGVHPFRVDASQDRNHAGTDSQDHHADKADGEGVPVRSHIRVREHLVRERSIEREERHHTARNQQPMKSAAKCKRHERT